jgi:hypothetical protein
VTIKHRDEYPEVLAASRDPHRLIALHEARCDEGTALTIMAWLLKERPIARPLKTVFAGNRGRATSMKRRPNGDYVSWISLPTITSGRLRIGIVLHEYAHLLTPGAKHGHVFTSMLDDLCELFLGATIRPAEVSLAATGYVKYQKRSKCFRCGIGTTRTHSTKPSLPCCGRCEREGYVRW